MSPAEKQFIENLNQSLGEYPNKDEILLEYQMHAREIMEEIDPSQGAAYRQLEERLGVPAEIAKMWKQEETITPKRTQWLFVIINVCLFVGGGLLTIGYNLFEWGWIEVLWGSLTNIPALIILIYLIFWGLLGYEIGKEFGHNGRKLLTKTFIVGVAPNIALMNLIVFRLIPLEWFYPLLNLPFILVCIVFTGLLYPVSMLGYRWGKKASV